MGDKQKTETMEEVKEKIIREYAVSFGDSPSMGIFRVIRPFRMKVVNGPLIPVAVGELCELSKDTATTLFCISKIEPLKMPSQFKVVRRFRMVENGRYIDLREGDIVEIEDKNEALSYWRKGYILPHGEEEV